MVVKTANEYMTLDLVKRIQYLQEALNHAEKIMHTFEEENNRLKDALISLASENNEGYVLDSEAFNEPVCSVW